MARKPTGNPVGPPPKQLNWELFEQLCEIQCTQSEICAMLKCDEKTLRNKCIEHYGEEYSLAYKRFSESGKCSLRRYQFVQAKSKPNMAIWLGKQYLGQKDNTEPPANQEVLSKLDAMMEQTRSLQKQQDTSQ